MTASAVQTTPYSPDQTAPVRRFDRIAISSVFGDPLDRSTWSGAPANVGRCLQKLGIAVEGVCSGIRRGELRLLALQYMLMGYGRPPGSEAVRRMQSARRRAGEQLEETLRRRRIRHVLHMGTLDLPARTPDSGIRHYLYCDHDWALSLAHRPDRHHYSRSAIAAFEDLEKQSLESVEHIFTFGTYVRDHIIDHYGVAADRVTAVGSGMGDIEPYAGAKDYDRPHLLFVAKHLFAAKGGVLLLDALRIARTHRPDIQLTIVGDKRSRPFVPDDPTIRFYAHLPWRELQRLMRMSSLLVQPMLNDPWGQVYLEAMASRTPVIGLNRNGLPEITEGGRHGFLVDRADPEQLATVILDALADPERLAGMGRSGQAHVLRSYSWDAVADRIAHYA